MADQPFKEEPLAWDKIGNVQTSDRIFRGHTCYEWHLETSLERACKAFYKGALTNAESMEKTLLREFKRRYHHYSVAHS
jgi:hypothetical protein